LTKWIDTSPAGDALLGPVADPAEVVRMRQADDADAVRLRPLDAERHRLGADHLAVALAAVERQQRAAVGTNLYVGIGQQAAFEHGVDVARRHADAVRVVAAQVGLDQVRGDLRRFELGRAGGADDRGDGGRQGVGAKDKGIGHGRGSDER
jgi:hypothetical protein